MWEDERAPTWRRRLRIWRALTGLLTVLFVAAVVGLFLTNSPWLLAAFVVLAIGVFWAQGQVATYRGRLERPARKIRERAEKAGVGRVRRSDPAES